jgi:hypothetical protein
LAGNVTTDHFGAVCVARMAALGASCASTNNNCAKFRALGPRVKQTVRDQTLFAVVNDLCAHECLALP